ncbi:24504_t:CDS:2, partial [Dentiscutata erythropus]
ECASGRTLCGEMQNKQKNLERDIYIAINKDVQGIPSHNQTFKSIAYADDLTIGVGSSSDWLEIHKLFDLYERASSARINNQKTQIVPQMIMARRANLPDVIDFKAAKEGLIAIHDYQTQRHALQTHGKKFFFQRKDFNRKITNTFLHLVHSLYSLSKQKTTAALSEQHHEIDKPLDEYDYNNEAELVACSSYLLLDQYVNDIENVNDIEGVNNIENVNDIESVNNIEGVNDIEGDDIEDDESGDSELDDQSDQEEDNELDDAYSND